jgi:hypothetical protein
VAGTKRKSGGPVAVASKRVRSDPTSSTPTYMNQGDLDDLSRDEFVEQVLKLEKQLKEALTAALEAKEFTLDELKEKSSKASQIVAVLRQCA